MRRPVIVVGVVVAMAVLAVPAVRRGIAGRVAALGAGVRTRVADFRLDFDTREAELRAQLLPSPEDVKSAERRRAAVTRDDVEPY
ncbi:hypothetical protein [Georgenia sunbinii]|uniref:hypothetical protein n=1 Tax=Georgenia sunbinii TaxID=3117728 RepID=UPI002F2613A2